MQSNGIEGPAEFARAFFLWLEENEVRAVILGKAGLGSDDVPSDIDFAVESDFFADLPQLIDGFAKSSGWRLCQILRHETTAAYFVCSSVRDPSLVVALDACSDYQRNGKVFQTADELLAAREKLTWGGDGLCEAVELCYRFAKAAAKGKDPDDCAAEFAMYPDAAREECGAWLASRWGVTISNWDAKDVALGLDAMRKHCRTRPSLRQPGAIARIRRRILHPTGLVIGPAANHVAGKWSEWVGRHFRHVTHVDRIGLRDVQRLWSSHLIFTAAPPPRWLRCLYHDCVWVPDLATTDGKAFASSVSQFLQSRVARREGFVTGD